MKGVLIVLDGLGDLPVNSLDGQTPLEAAEMPNLDFLANRSEFGYLYPIKPNVIPDTDTAIVSMFGNNFAVGSRGQLESHGADIKITRGDLALRVNFATIDYLEEGNIIDRRAGRTLTTKEAESLSKALNKIKIPREFVFKNTIQHRAVLVLKGGFSDSIIGNDISYTKQKSAKKNIYSKALEDDENSQYTVNVLNEFLEKAHEVLDHHPINEERRKKGLMPANYLLVRGPGVETPKLKFYKKWLSVAYVPVIKGFAKISGMKVFSFKYPTMKKLDVYENLYKGLKKACKFSIKTLKKNHKKFDYAYIHIKETDLPGHDNKPLDKKKMLEYLDDTLFDFLRKFATKKKIKIVVTGDHSTPCKLKGHSADPVPLLFYPADERGPKERKFNEKNARRGTLGKIEGNELLKRIGFV